MISPTVSKWLRGLVLNRPLKQTQAIMDAASKPSGAVLVSDLYEEPETVPIEQAVLDKGLTYLCPATDSVQHYLGFINDDEEFGDAAIYAAAIGNGWQYWLTVITEGESEMEVRLFDSPTAASAHVAATMCLQEAERPIAWDCYSRKYIRTT